MTAWWHCWSWYRLFCSQWCTLRCPEDEHPVLHLGLRGCFIERLFVVLVWKYPGKDCIEMFKVYTVSVTKISYHPPRWSSCKRGLYACVSYFLWYWWLCENSCCWTLTLWNSHVFRIERVTMSHKGTELPQLLQVSENTISSFTY